MKLDNKGFTLVEVLAVVVIIGILGGVAITGVLSAINTSKDASYNMMISDIVTASENMYNEVDFSDDADDGAVFQYNNGGNLGSKVVISSNTINTNLQTLVSNGFLSGEENGNKDKEDASNKNNRIILDPKTRTDIGDCEIEITKTINNNNTTTYDVKSKSSDSKCPTSYKKQVK